MSFSTICIKQGVSVVWDTPVLPLINGMAVTGLQRHVVCLARDFWEHCDMYHVLGPWLRKPSVFLSRSYALKSEQAQT